MMMKVHKQLIETETEIVDPMTAMMKATAAMENVHVKSWVVAILLALTQPMPPDELDR